MPTKEEQDVALHNRVCKTLNEIYARKNHDYGNAFSDSWRDFGPIIGAVRISDKVHRLVTLTKKNATQKVVDESIADTLLDCANYCIMSVMEMLKEESQKAQPQADPNMNNPLQGIPVLTNIPQENIPKLVFDGDTGTLQPNHNTATY